MKQVPVPDTGECQVARRSFVTAKSLAGHTPFYQLMSVWLFQPALPILEKTVHASDLTTACATKAGSRKVLSASKASCGADVGVRELSSFIMGAHRNFEYRRTCRTAGTQDSRLGPFAHILGPSLFESHRWRAQYDRQKAVCTPDEIEDRSDSRPGMQRGSGRSPSAMKQFLIAACHIPAMPCSVAAGQEITLIVTLS